MIKAPPASNSSRENSANTASPSCSDPQSQQTRQDHEQYEPTKDADQHLVSSRTGRVQYWTTVDTLTIAPTERRRCPWRTFTSCRPSPSVVRARDPCQGKQQRNAAGRENERKARKQRTVGQTRTRLARRQLGQKKSTGHPWLCISAHVCCAALRALCVHLSAAYTLINRCRAPSLSTKCVMVGAKLVEDVLHHNDREEVEEASLLSVATMPRQLNWSIVDVEPRSVRTPRRVSNYSSAGTLLLLVLSAGDLRTLSPRAGPISRGVIVFMLCGRFWIRKTVTSKVSWICPVYSGRDQPWAGAGERRRK